MTDQPLVSIVVPTYNQGHYLPIALDSVMFQDYPNIEIIICNHGSTDNTKEVINAFLKEVGQQRVSFLKRYSPQTINSKIIRQEELRYPQNRQITVLQSDENIGGTSSYNEGFKAAQGTYCTYLPADDYFFPGAISQMVTCLERTGCDFVYADMFLVDDKGRILQHLKKPNYSFQACFSDWYHLGVCKLYRRTLHDTVGFYDPGYRNANDYDMYLRFAMAGASFHHIAKTLYCVRKHDAQNQNEPASWRHKGYENLIRESIICCERAREHLEIVSKGSG
ncbi:MAG: glycosyltransferase [Deltaproteobacteria bacterium]|nr:glycosyltransferase [Deltaproteobacteria bacterium]MBW2153074.1 glycosyltransferase [Deltaproteobacteria bacterium]